MMQRKRTSSTLFWILLGVCCAACFVVGCDKSGELDTPPTAPSAVGPTIYSLVAQDTTLSRSSGGILTVSCKWTSPYKVATAAAYLAFVRSVKDIKTEPVGIIGTETASVSTSLRVLRFSGSGDGLRPEVLFQTASETASGTADVASDTVAFYNRFQDPLVFSTGIGTEELEGAWGVEIPFTKNDIGDAPLGKQQMLLWMMVNGYKTNTLAFEIEFSL